jgi:hypothetical protein
MDGSAVEVWNAATALGSSGTVGPEVPTGTAHLARLLRFHNAAMGGGLGFALEVTGADQLEAVASAADCLDLVDVARLVRRLDADGRDFDLAEGLNDAYCEATGETRVGEEVEDYADAVEVRGVSALILANGKSPTTFVPTHRPLLQRITWDPTADVVANALRLLGSIRSAYAGSGGGPGFELALTQLTPARQERP